MFAGTLCAQFPPPPPDPNPPNYEEPPEEDAGIATPKVYTFNPLQAKKEIEVGDFNLKRGNLKGASYRYREATLWDDGNANAFFKLGDVSERMKDYATAKEAFQKYASLTDDKKKVAEVQKRLEKYPKDTPGPKAAGGPVSIEDARKEDRAINGTARGKGVITIMKK
jgi:tetratricopeptide (TPR) repeat protein